MKQTENVNYPSEQKAINQKYKIINRSLHVKNQKMPNSKRRNKK